MRAMTTLTVVDGFPGESRSQAVARRLRGELGQLRISVSEAARRMGITQSALSRRMNGDVTFDVEELDHICTVLGVSFEYVTTGIRAIPSNPPPDPSWGLPSQLETARKNRRKGSSHTPDQPTGKSRGGLRAA